MQEEEAKTLSPQAAGDSIHQGHRQRMLRIFLESGPAAFSDIQLLEFILSYSIARRDTNALAHALLEEFGSLHRVFEATGPQLQRVPGIGPRSAALLQLMGGLWPRLEQSRLKETLFLYNTKDIGRYLMSRVQGVREERAYLLCLDARCRVIECRELCRGAVNAVNLPFRKLVEAALLCNASTVVLAHTHTNGSVLPSLADIEYTREAKRALKLVEVELTDHFVLGNDSFLSMRGSGYFAG